MNAAGAAAQDQEEVEKEKRKEVKVRSELEKSLIPVLCRLRVTRTEASPSLICGRADEVLCKLNLYPCMPFFFFFKGSRKKSEAGGEAAEAGSCCCSAGRQERRRVGVRLTPSFTFIFLCTSLLSSASASSCPGSAFINSQLNRAVNKGN